MDFVKYGCDRKAYLRSVAARVPCLDRITGKQIAPVTSGQIYWGAVPFVCIQLIMVILTLSFPQMVMHYKSEAANPGSIEMMIPDLPEFEVELK
ncbi:TRAP transporter large permease subunit [Rhizobiales bacterium L72]|uniref:TRAP transporter large permease subunit n=1 Tax=Propylenella binzhouense TaxID=2555902 RepID=A0A964T141_9HYPH|nr:TRAP transporter large permease subunit [Propylenella binzhouense]